MALNREHPSVQQYFAERAEGLATGVGVGELGTASDRESMSQAPNLEARVTSRGGGRRANFRSSPERGAVAETLKSGTSGEQLFAQVNNDEIDQSMARAKLEVSTLEERVSEASVGYKEEWNVINPNYRYTVGGRTKAYGELTPDEMLELDLATQKKRFGGFGKGEIVPKPLPGPEVRAAFETYQKRLQAASSELSLARGRLSGAQQIREYQDTVVKPFSSAERQAQRRAVIEQFSQALGREIVFAPDEVVVVPGDGGSKLETKGGQKALKYFIPLEGKYSPQSNGIGGYQGPREQFRGVQSAVLEQQRPDGSTEYFLYVHKPRSGDDKDRFGPQDFGQQKMPTPSLKARMVIKDGQVREHEVI